MGSILQKDDKIFTIYKQYIDLIRDDVEKNNEFVYGIDQLAARLTTAHLIDGLIEEIKTCRNEFPPERKAVPYGVYNRSQL